MPPRRTSPRGRKSEFEPASPNASETTTISPPCGLSPKSLSDGPMEKPAAPKSNGALQKSPPRTRKRTLLTEAPIAKPATLIPSKKKQRYWSRRPLAEQASRNAIKSPNTSALHGQKRKSLSEDAESMPASPDDSPSNKLHKRRVENFHERPSIKITIPDHIKAILVDDWENVTKSQQLVPLPAAHTVASILDDYFAFERPKRQPGSPQENILEEVMAGLKDYFERCLGRILLYRFERQQYTEVREAWNSADGELAGKDACSTYGAEHLCRLLVTLPELISQTNMDAQSVNRLREELGKMCNWLSRNAEKYFVKEYDTPNPEYVEKARSV